MSTKYEVRKRNGGMVAEFEIHAEAVSYLESSGDPLLYIEEIGPPPPPPTPRPPPGKFEIWYAEMLEKRWFRCLNGLILFGIGWAILIYSEKEIYTYAGWACMIFGGLAALEISLALLGIYSLFTIFDGLKNISTPIAILLGACIIAYVIYIKKK